MARTEDAMSNPIPCLFPFRSYKMYSAAANPSAANPFIDLYNANLEALARLMTPREPAEAEVAPKTGFDFAFGPAASLPSLEPLAEWAKTVQENYLKFV